MTPHLNRLVETVQMRGHIMVSIRNKKNYPSSIIKYLLLSRALCVSFYNILICISVYVGCATVGAAAWWFMVYENGPKLNYYQLVRSYFFNDCVKTTLFITTNLSSKILVFTEKVVDYIWCLSNWHYKEFYHYKEDWLYIGTLSGI